MVRRVPEVEIDTFSDSKNLRSKRGKNDENGEKNLDAMKERYNSSLVALASCRRKWDFDRSNFQQEQSTEFLKPDVYTNPMNQFCQRLAEKKYSVQYKPETQPEEDGVKFRKPVGRTMLG